MRDAFNNTFDNSTEYTSGWIQGPDSRGTGQILWSNLLTLFLCVFTAIHLNIPPEGTTKVHFWFLRWKWVLITLFFPELTLYMAGKQWFTASRLHKKLNRYAIPLESAEEERKVDPRPFWRRFVKPARPIPLSAPGSRCSFNMVYGYYAMMGGFVVDVSSLHDSLSRLTISPKGVVFLAQHGHLLHVREMAITDKSKADLLTKSFVCVQVTWQVVQTITRRATGLPITLLEVHIFVHVVGALVMYVLWWSKPLDVQDPTVVNSSGIEDLLALMLMRNYGLGRKAARIHGPEEARVSIQSTEHVSHHNGAESAYLQVYAPAPAPAVDQLGRPSSGSDSPQPRIVTHDATGSDVDFVTRSSLGHPVVYSLVSGEALECGIGPARSVHALDDPPQQKPGRLRIDLSERDIRRWTLAARALERIGEPLHYPDRSVSLFTLHTPNIFLNHKGLLVGFYGYFCTWASGGLMAALVLCCFYGGAHMVVWNSRFPTPLEQLLWRISCIDNMAGMTSVLAAFSFIMYQREHGVKRLLRAFWTPEPGWLAYPFRLLVLFGLLNLPLFLLSRLYIVVETFISLRHVPTGIYRTVPWTNYIPHF